LVVKELVDLSFPSIDLPLHGDKNDHMKATSFLVLPLLQTFFPSPLDLYTNKSPHFALAGLKRDNLLFNRFFPRIYVYKNKLMPPSKV
jgi:hypothetical protein